MGSITAYEIGSGRRYRVRWRDDQQKQVEKKGFRTKREAELYLAHTAVSRSNGSYTDPGEARITVGALGVDWLRNKKHALKASSFSDSAVANRPTFSSSPTWRASTCGARRPSRE